MGLLLLIISYAISYNFYFHFFFIFTKRQSGLFYLFYFQELIVSCLIFFQKSVQNIWSVKKNALLLHPLSRTTVLSYKASIVARLLQQRLTIKIFKNFSLKILQNQKPALSLQSVSERSQFDSSIHRFTDSSKNHSGDFLNEVVFFERLNIQTTKTRLRKKIATVSFLLLWKLNR